MKSVDVFCGVDGHQDFLCIHLRRQRQLHQDAVDIVAAIEIVDQNQQVLGGCRFGRRVLLAIDAELFAGFDFAAYVDLGGMIAANQNRGESGAHSGSDHGFDPGGHFAADVVGNLCAV